jgi:type IV pilus assembly protein PilQ
VSAFPSANALVIQETVARLNTIKGVIEQIDLPRPQVYIETKFVELNDSAIKDIGIDWSMLGSDESGLGYTLGGRNLKRDFTETQRDVNQDALVNFDVGRQLGSLTRNRGDVDADQRNHFQSGSELDVLLSGKNFETVQDNPNGSIQIETILPMERVEVLTSILSAEDFELTLSALNQDDGVDIVSNPKVIVANEETATIHVGRNEPNVIAVPQGDTGDRFAFTLDSRNPFIEIGVKLEVTPTVNTEDNITIRLTPELSRLIGQKEVGEGATKITFPITQIRKVQTQFNLESGNTVAIGGLSEANDVENIKKIPVLGDIPLLGKYLFTHTHTEKVKDEVIIFVTVGMAEPENLVEVAGVPSESELIHEHLARRAARAHR